MIYAVAGESLTFPVKFAVNGDLVVPDADSVTVTLRNQAGSIISGWNKKAVDHEGKNGPVCRECS